MFFEQQISILEGFLKDRVTLNTGVMMLNIQLWSQEYIWKYIKTENRYITVFTVFLIKH